MISQIFDYNDDVQGEFIKVDIPENILILKETLHHEFFTAGYPHLYPVKKSLCGPCLMYEIEGYDKFEEDWVYQFLQMILYYCMFESKNHLPEKYHDYKKKGLLLD